MSQQIVLRDYQQECVQAIEDAGEGSHLIVMATGLGKTVTFAHMPRTGRMLILSHRDELVRQPEKYFDCSFGIEKADLHSDGEDVVSASVQTLSRGSRLKQFSPDEFDIIVTDEAHHAVAPSYRKVIDYFKPRVHVGFTATPNRDDGRGLSRVFDDIVFERDLKWGITNGYLTDIDCRRVLVSWSTKGVHSRGGDFAINELSNAVNTKVANEQVGEAYRQLAIGQTLVFASSVTHAYALQEHIPNSRVVDGKTPVEERRELIEAFTNREFPALINFGVFTEGTDLPLIETVLLARPTRNQSLYTQMVGRGLRPSEGKDFLRLIDCMGASERNKICTAPSLFGFNEEDFSEEARKVLDGSLLGLEGRVLDADDTPTGWILRERKVDILGTSISRVAWLPLPGNKHLVSGAGFSVELIGPDAIGGYTVIYHGQEATTTRHYDDYEQADRHVFLWLSRNPNSACDRMRALWDADLASNWSGRAPTRAQLDYLASLLPNGELARLDRLGRITRRECALLIELQSEKNEREQLEKTGACPACGRGLRLSKSGKTWSCVTNVWRKDEDGCWQRVAGCGFSIPSSFGNKRLPEDVVKSLVTDRKALFGRGYLMLDLTDGVWNLHR